MASTGRNGNRVSPRKFSEKIALLNKKEQEGNKEFEEIIKEVQATKSQTSLKRHADGCSPIPGTKCDLDAPILNRDSLEEVYESLIKYVQQSDDEPNYDPCQARQQQQRLTEQNILSEDPLPDLSRLNNHHYTPTSTTNSNQQIIYDNRQQTRGFVDQTSTNNDCVQITNTRNDSFNNINVIEDPNPSTIPETEYPQQVQAQLHSDLLANNSSSMRGRVTSVGSANCSKYLCHNLQLKHNECLGEFLTPTIDKSWPKSCSDPILNIPISAASSTNINQSIPMQHLDNHNISPATTIDLKQEPACAINVDHNSTIQQHTTTNMYNQTATNDFDRSYCRAGYENDRIDLASNASPAARVSLSTKLYHNPRIDNIQQDDTLDASSISTGEVPGIQICAIDDIRNDVPQTDGQETPSDGIGCGSRDSSLPDISNLQFGISSPENSNYAGPHYGSTLGYEDHTNGPGKMLDLNLHNNDNNNVNGSSWFNRQQMNTCLSQQQRYMNRTVMSNSDCGMLHQSNQEQQDSSLINTDQYNIIRSRSHNSIDHLAKHQAQERLVNNQDLNINSNTQQQQTLLQYSPQNICHQQQQRQQQEQQQYQHHQQEQQYNNSRDYYVDNSYPITYQMDYSAPYSN